MYQLTYSQRVGDFRRRLRLKWLQRINYFRSIRRRNLYRRRVFRSYSLPYLDMLSSMVVNNYSSVAGGSGGVNDGASGSRRRKLNEVGSGLKDLFPSGGVPIDRSDVPARIMKKVSVMDYSGNKSVGLKRGKDFVGAVGEKKRMRFSGKKPGHVLHGMSVGDVPLKRYVFANLGPQSDSFGNRYDKVALYLNGNRLGVMRSDQLEHFSGFNGSIAAQMGQYFQKHGVSDRDFATVFVLDVDDHGFGVVRPTEMFADDLWYGNPQLGDWVTFDDRFWHTPVGGDMPHYNLSDALASFDRSDFGDKGMTASEVAGLRKVAEIFASDPLSEQFANDVVEFEHKGKDEL